MQVLNECKITENFCIIDDFCKEFSKIESEKAVFDGKPHRHKPNRMSDSEIILILLMFHLGGYRCLKHYYMNHILPHCRHLFPRVVSYNRFVELERDVMLETGIFVKCCLLAECTGISFVDSTPLRVCDNHRIHLHKTFAGYAARGKCSMGWFYGFKLHLIVNDKGEIINFTISPGDTDERTPLYNQRFVEKITGKLCGDKGYVSRTLFENLFVGGIQLITKLKKKMKNTLMSQTDKIILRHRALVESINDELKNIAQVEHSRHRSVANFLCNTFAAIAAYCYLPKKPALNLVFDKDDNKLMLF
jgi:hypothetical protein